MDPQTFQLLHTTPDANNINKDATININYDIISSTEGRITGLTVTVKTNADYTQALTATNQIDLENVLLTATSVQFMVSGQPFDLKIVNRIRHRNKNIPTPNPYSDYFYFEVTPTSFTRSINEIQEVTDVTFYPFVQDAKYDYNDYNPLISNALNNRTSTLAQQSDRQGSSTNPTNLIDLLTGSATPAQIQDSNYSLTGWSNARYRGTATNAQNYKGIPPAITVSPFQGEVSPSSSLNSLICSRSLSDRIVVELLSTENQEVPSFEGFFSTRYELLQQVGPGTTTILYKINATPVTGSLEIGSIIKVGNKAELLRITNIEPGFNRLVVTRGYLGTTSVTLNATDRITVVKPLKIFKAGIGGANIVASTNTKVWVKESQEILFTDSYGLVYSSSSLCVT